VIEVEENIDTFLAEAARLALDVLASNDPYDSGLAFMGFAMREFGRDQPVNDWAAGLYLLWGSLTDGVDGPQPDPAAVAAWAVHAMRRAAAEWLALPPADTIARTEYLDRWVHEECGYERRDST